MNIISQPSPNHSSRDGVVVDTLVLHYTGMRTAEDALTRMCDAEAEVSAHYMLDEDGTVYQLVDEAEKAWHAGVSHWAGRDGVNAFSIGIEIVNPGHEFGYRAFPKTQMVALVELCKAILERHDIPACHVIGHSDVAPSRKEDPGELFDWPWLAQQGIGLWPKFETKSISNINLVKLGDEGARVLSIQKNLQAFGYGVPITGRYCEATRAVVIAFQRHFRPQDFSGVWDTDSDVRLAMLLEAIG